MEKSQSVLCSPALKNESMRFLYWSYTENLSHEFRVFLVVGLAPHPLQKWLP